ncbi:DNA-binding response regulator [Achromobacter xylosoxidans]
MMSPDEQARTAAVSALLQAGISARGCSTSLELFGLLNSGVHDAVVLDVDALGEIGYALIARLHGSSALGIIVTGKALSLDDRLRCLQSGADACLPGAQDPRELACMLLALARRLPVGPSCRRDGAASGQWELRDQGWTLVAPSGTAISLSANERLIVRSLLEVAGRGSVNAMNWAMSCVSKAAAPAPAARAAST